MAIGVTNRASNGDTSNATTYTSASFTPGTGGSLLVACFAATRGSGANPDIPSVSDTLGTHLTWVQVADFLYGSIGANRYRMTIFAARAPAIPSAMQVIPTYAGALTGCAWSIFEVTGTDVANGVYPNCFPQAVNTAANSTGASASVTLSAAGNAANRAFLFAAHNANEVYALATNWVGIGSGNYASPAIAAQSQWNSTAFDTNPNTSWSTSAVFGMIGLEIKALVATPTYSLIVDSASYAVAANDVNFGIKIPVTTANFALTVNPIQPIWNVNCPVGLFYLPSQNSMDPVILNDASIDGTVFGGNWFDLEQNEGVYTFNSHLGGGTGTTLDDMVALVAAANKPCRLSFNTGGGGHTAYGGSQPDWLDAYLTAKGTQFMTLTGSHGLVKFPVFWDPWYLAKVIALVQAVANHIGPLSQLKLVYVPWVNANTDDWNIGSMSPVADGQAPTGSSPQSRWVAMCGAGSPYPGYSDVGAALIDAGAQLYAAFASIFPGKIITTSIGRLEDAGFLMNPGGSTNHGRNIIETVLSAAQVAHPGRIAVQKNSMNGNPVGGAPYPIPTPPAISKDFYDLYYMHLTYGMHVGCQMTWHSFGDSACSPDNFGGSRMNGSGGCADSTELSRLAGEKTKAYKGKWAEVYEIDLDNLGSTNADPATGLTIYDVNKHVHRTLVSGWYINFGSNENNNGGAGPITLQPTGNYAFGLGAVNFRLQSLSIAPATAGYAFGLGAVNFKVLITGGQASYPYVLRDIGLLMKRKVVPATINYGLSIGAVNFRVSRKVAPTTPNYQFGLRLVNFIVTMPVDTASFGVAVSDVHFPRGQQIDANSYPVNFSSVGLRARRILTVDTANVAFAINDVGLSKSQNILRVTTANYPLTLYAISVPVQLTFETAAFGYELNVVGLDYEPLVPPPSPLQDLAQFPPGSKIYVTQQGDRWDLISLRVYGMQRGSDHHMDTLLGANPALQDFSELPGGVFVLVPSLPVQTDIPLVPWKRATVSTPA